MLPVVAIGNRRRTKHRHLRVDHGGDLTRADPGRTDGLGVRHRRGDPRRHVPHAGVHAQRRAVSRGTPRSRPTAMKLFHWSITYLVAALPPHRDRPVRLLDRRAADLVRPALGRCPAVRTSSANTRTRSSSSASSRTRTGGHPGAQHRGERLADRGADPRARHTRCSSSSWPIPSGRGWHRYETRASPAPRSSASRSTNPSRRP